MTVQRGRALYKPCHGALKIVTVSRKGLLQLRRGQRSSEDGSEHIKGGHALDKHVRSLWLFAMIAILGKLRAAGWRKSIRYPQLMIAIGYGRIRYR
jgi:hypothetical protein